MSSKLYFKMAKDNLKSNRRFYVPYLLACIGTIMMFYILTALAFDKAINEMNSQIRLVLAYGVVIVGIFSVIILLYTNSVLIKQRKKEFGMYNILGMEKRHIGHIIFIENIYNMFLSLIFGIGLGVIFAKLMQLLLTKIINAKINFEMKPNTEAVFITCSLFLGIFLIIFICNYIVIRKNNPIDLIHGSSAGEKEPKSKWITAILGIICLGIGYAMAIMTKSAVAAVLLFFVAVLFVIFGTYLTFTAFSIIFLKLLKKNKRYYYKTSHFATVSGMLYRMKRNAAGLASICILSAMVLATIATTVSLYAGINDALGERYPRDIIYENEEVRSYEDRQTAINQISSIMKSQNRKMTDIRNYSELRFTGVKEGNSFIAKNPEFLTKNEQMIINYVMTAKDYNELTGENLSLKSDELYIFYSTDVKNKSEGENIEFLGKSYKITKLDKWPLECSETYLGYGVCKVIVSDESELMRVESYQAKVYGDNSSKIRFIYEFNTDGEKNQVKNCISMIRDSFKDNQSVDISGRAEMYDEYMGFYGSLFFIGILLGIVFIFATVLIIYYKQISEGYDDHDRFEIMQKVGMTTREVTKTIHSQVLIVFFLPLVTAGIHIAFAFPMIRRILLALGMVNTKIYIISTLGTFVVFSIFYIIVYLITAGTYRKIIDGKK